MLNNIISIWRSDLERVLYYYTKKRSIIDNFFWYLFCFFIFINITCYWFAMISAFPELVFGPTFKYYFKIQFPVGILGSLFDSLSFFVTIYIIKKAIVSFNNKIYLAHLSIDFLIAVLATFWVIFVFIISGWAVSYLDTVGHSIETIESYDHETNINKRTDKYLNSVNDALQNPSKNKKNIYFGIIMGLSAMIPTIIHLTMFFRSFYFAMKNRKNDVDND